MSKKSIGSRTLKAGAALLAVGAGVAAINAKNKNGTEKQLDWFCQTSCWNSAS